MAMFPDDCTSKCPHWYGYDLSIDDWVYGCKLLGIEVDVGWTLYKTKCPLEIEERRAE